MTAKPDRLAELSRELDGIGDVPLEERAEIFERAHRVLIDELNALEEG